MRRTPMDLSYGRALLGLIGLQLLPACTTGELPASATREETPASLTISPTLHDFGAVTIDKRSLPFIFAITNVGGAVAGVPMITISGGDFSQTSTCTTVINRGGGCTISVMFRPSTPGLQNGLLQVEAVPGGRVVASLAGVGTSVEWALTPSTHDFGPTAVGAASAPFLWAITNTGSDALGELAVAVNGADFVAPVAGNTCAGALASGATCSVAVQFRPLSRGSKSGSLTVTGDGHTVTVALTGQGTSSPELAISPMRQSFTGLAGKQGSPVIFTVVNFGDSTSGALSTALGGPDADSFRLINVGCGAPLPSGGTCQVGVAAAAAIPGSKTATLTISSPAGGMVVAELSATIIVGDGFGTITPSSADFGIVDVNTTSAPISFQANNHGGTPTAPLAATVSTGEFVITADSCSATALPAGMACTVSVSARPTSPGAKTALLTLTGGPGEVSLAALSVAGRDPAPDAGAHD
jgi:hypothetical protein